MGGVLLALEAHQLSSKNLAYCYEFLQEKLLEPTPRHRVPLWEEPGWRTDLPTSGSTACTLVNRAFVAVFS